MESHTPTHIHRDLLTWTSIYMYEDWYYTKVIINKLKPQF